MNCYKNNNTNAWHILPTPQQYNPNDELLLNFYALDPKLEVDKFCRQDDLNFPHPLHLPVGHSHPSSRMDNAGVLRRNPGPLSFARMSLIVVPPPCRALSHQESALLDRHLLHLDRFLVVVVGLILPWGILLFLIMYEYILAHKRIFVNASCFYICYA